ncbi:MULTISPECIES: protein jag [unclassified Pseudoclavibacter]|uniref:Jag family protein n=1 Tax=unclassified Pseudoclavibacter TaxID=2615177 RepID=UPI0013017F11|nr:MULTISPECIES: R3H domain-containing nucleic acid-binding protein [unclassified Pseudoclavibacter]KAB1657417.1 DNA-binding protein [Pseudoclavibacter sp. CFCC 11306]KAB1660710.1 DNA-binding protein [Pseudoclavibacter sp. CFCC 13796]KAB1662957.1 DNA-binding protein [Pseudoclavibacter sp. CFCC 13611]
MSDEQSSETRSALEIEGDIAADYIEEFLDIADFDGDIDIEVRSGRAYIGVNSDDEDSNLSTLASPRVVSALQELTRLAVQQKTGEFSRLVLDVQGSREQREHELEELVQDAAERLQAGDDRVALPGMSSYERKLVHDFARAEGLESDSEGEGRRRHVVLTLGGDEATSEHESDGQGSSADEASN